MTSQENRFSTRLAFLLSALGIAVEPGIFGDFQIVASTQVTMELEPF